MAATSTVLLNPQLTNHLCGATRKGHFEGVLLVVSKLLNRIQPDVVVFGEKDYQQYIILKQMAIELLYPTDVLACPIIREPSGLAMSSRNARLSDRGREAAMLLYRSLQVFKSQFAKLSPPDIPKADLISANGKSDLEIHPEVVRFRAELTELEEVVGDIIISNGMNSIDYVQILDSETLQPVTARTRSIICGLAVYTDKVRLIDNMVLPVYDDPDEMEMPPDGIKAEVKVPPGASP